MRRILLTTATFAALLAPAYAQQPAPGTQAGSAQPDSAQGAPQGVPQGAAVPNPVLAKVGDKEIHQSDVAAAAQGLPEQYRNLPPQVLYPMLLDQVIDREVLVVQARKEGLQNDPKVQEQMRAADDRVLQNALLSREVGPTLTEPVIRAQYDKEYAGKSGAEEVHAEHILVDSKDKAEKLIEQVKGGADFAELAKKNSSDPGAANGGDLGWFKKSDMVPAFADAAFSLKPGDVDPQPVQTQFGWHVIKVLGKRQAPPPAFEQVQDQIRQQLIRDGVQKTVGNAKKDVQIVKYNPDGTVAAPPADVAPQGAAAPASPPAASSAAPAR